MSRRAVYTHSSAYTGTTPLAVGTAKPSRYARVYSGTSPNPVTADDAEDAGVSQKRPTTIR